IESAMGLNQEFLRVPIQVACDELCRSGSPFEAEDVLREPALRCRHEFYRKEGIRSLLAVPAKIQGQTAVTISFYYRRAHRFEAIEVRMASALANLMASAVGSAELYGEQARMRAAAEEARKRSQFIAEASILLSSSLNYTTTLASVAKLAVPHMADWCAVDVLDERGALRELAIAHVDPSKVDWARELRRRYPSESRALTGPPQVLRTGKSEMVTEVSDALLREAACDAEHLRLLRQVGFTSFMCVPMIARGKILGVISFISAESGRRYGPVDLELAEDLAGHGAIAIDNARLYAEAQRNAERLRLALDSGQMGIWDWNLRTGELDWSEKLETIHGLATGAFGRSFESFLSTVHPDDRQAVIAVMGQSGGDGRQFTIEYRVVWPDGSAHWVQGNGQAHFDEHGNFTRMIGLATDVTARRQLEEKLRQAQKLESVGLLAGGVAHDFNNLLTGILGNASLAADLSPAQGPIQGLLADVVCAGEKAADLTRQLLAYSGKGQFLIEPLDLSEVVRGIANLVQVSIPRLVGLRLVLAPDLPKIEADRCQIEQVIMNLGINAGEAIGEKHGTVLIRTGVRDLADRDLRESFPETAGVGRYVYLEVTDSGSGMDESTLRKVFDPFFTTKFTGRGLGLAAVSGIVRSHRGAIQVSSAPGVGSTFRILLPTAPL
ncbi:MAG: GAF domain-containing protein, partial [Acidobacteria bacterium]|nr:GAF domain-containing protein [Acidobacteriota bacterium]